MPILKVKTALYFALLSGFWLGAGSTVFAQNYVDIESYGGQQVTINFDALDDGAADPYSTTPFSNPGLMLQEDLPIVTQPRVSAAPTAPLVLTPPPMRQPPIVAPIAQMVQDLPAQFASAVPALVAPPVAPPVAPMVAPLPKTVQPLGVTTPSKPLPVVTAPPVVQPSFVPKPAQFSAPAPSARVLDPMVAKAMPLPAPIPSQLPPMPVAPVEQMAIAAPPPVLPPALPTLPDLMPSKAQALPAPVVAARTQAVAAADAPQRILFIPGSDVLTPQGRQQLAALAQLLSAETSTRVQLRSYAASSVDDAGDARRLSLARGLSVRGQLLQQGARPSQIDVRALGAAGGGGTDTITGAAVSVDRVDVVVLR